MQIRIKNINEERFEEYIKLTEDFLLGYHIWINYDLSCKSSETDYVIVLKDETE